MRLLVTGGRHYTDADTVRRVLGRALARHPGLVLVVGDCPTGLDAGAWWWAVEAGVPVERFEAEWQRFGLSAGPRRNARMVASNPDVCVSFPGGRGTADCTQRAVAAGVKTGAVSSGDRVSRLGVQAGQLVWW